MDTEMNLSEKMTRFLAGHWTTDRPTEPGDYLVRAPSSGTGPSGIVVAYWANDISGGGSTVCHASISHEDTPAIHGHDKCRIMLSMPWQGEFWSVPWPGTPEAAGKPAEPTRDAWEYMPQTVWGGQMQDVVAMARRMGSDGWELCATDRQPGEPRVDCYFKRQVTR